MIIDTAVGWAVLDGGKIKLRSVCDTRRSAIVNFLYAERRIMILRNASDDDIERIWTMERAAAIVMPVAITADDDLL